MIRLQSSFNTSLLIKNSEITYNSTGNKFLCIYAKFLMSLNITNTSINLLSDGSLNNLFKYENSKIYIKSSYFNTVNSFINLHTSEISIENSVFINTLLVMSRTSINVYNSSFNISIYSENSIIYCINCPLLIINSLKCYNNIMLNNNSYGGAICINNDNISLNLTYISIENSLFLNNSVNGFGGAIYLKHCYGSIENSEFNTNTAINGGGLYIENKCIIYIINYIYIYIYTILYIFR